MIKNFLLKALSISTSLDLETESTFALFKNIPSVSTLLEYTDTINSKIHFIQPGWSLLLILLS